MDVCYGFALLTVLTLCECLVPQLIIPDGKIQGYYDKTAAGRTFAAFEGIPYARPPVGKYRFKDSQPSKPWKGVWIANYTVKCIQYDHNSSYTSERIFGEEDCLHLNVYSPQLSQDSLLDVIVFIHGGAFMFNAGYLYGPKYLMDSNVVYVTINYRLGPFGFLSTEDDIVPGNMGMKDQVMALKWIQKNIQYFGGNPQSVLLTGLSAGGASVTYHYLSPMSQNLFHKGIAMSGVSINPWAETEGALEKAKKIAASVGCDFKSTEEMVNCLRYRPARQILSKIEILQPFLYNPFSPFGPVVEKSGLNPFISESAIKLLQKGLVADLPLLLSSVKDEGLYPGAEFQANPSYLPEIDQRWEKLAPHILDFNYTANPADHVSLARQIRQHYLGDQPIAQETYTNLIKMIGDRLFTNTIETAGKMFSKQMTSEVYMMYFAYRGKYSRSDRLSQKTDNFGVCHADDLIYLVDSNWAHPLDNENDKKMVGIMTNLWTSFAKFGVPQVDGVNFTALPKQKAPLSYLHIESPSNIHMATADTISDRHFWNSLPINENLLSIQIKEEL